MPPCTHLQAPLLSRPVRIWELAGQPSRLALLLPHVHGLLSCTGMHGCCSSIDACFSTGLASLMLRVGRIAAEVALSLRPALLCYALCRSALFCSGVCCPVKAWLCGTVSTPRSCIKAWTTYT